MLLGLFMFVVLLLRLRSVIYMFVLSLLRLRVVGTPSSGAPRPRIGPRDHHDDAPRYPALRHDETHPLSRRLGTRVLSQTSVPPPRVYQRVVGHR